jgi:cytochrome oxidase assembly protein ShyY1
MKPPANKLSLILSTLVVLALIGVMVALGLWQLRRADEKTAAIALMRANLARPAVSFPAMGPVVPDTMFRPSAVTCLRVAGWSVEAGKAADGVSGFRYIAHCVTGAEGPGALVALGVGGRPDLKPAWTGGRITGRLVEEPDHRSLLARAVGPRQVLRPMLVADSAPVGLKTPAPPRVEDVPNSHVSYAVQWFLFAVTATIIYLIALWRRLRAS